MLRSALLIMSGNAAASLLLLLRNLLLARLLTTADYGIVATFAMVMAVVEMASAFGLHQQIVQSKEGDDPRFQSALQGFQLLRGLVSGGAMVLLAQPLADFLGIPEVAWAYQILAVVPVLNALVHFDIHRLNRRQIFGPMLLTGVVPALVSLLAVWPLVWQFGDWRAMLWSSILQAALAVIFSHLLAERPWRAIYDRKVYTGSFRFGWPIMLEAVLLFFVFQGDKLIVGRELGMEVLAIFAMGTTLTLTPSLVFGKSLNNFMLPRLSGADDRAQFETWAQGANLLSFGFGAVFVCGACLLGPLLIAVLLGQKYVDLGEIIVGLAVIQGLRVAKSGAAVVSLSQALVKNSLYSNLFRVALLPLAWLALEQGQGLGFVIYLAIVGEACGLILALVLQSRGLGISVGPLLPSLGLMTACFGLALGFEAGRGGALQFLAALVAGLAVVTMLGRLRRTLRG